jgi:hypothetical protein
MCSHGIFAEELFILCIQAYSVCILSYDLFYSAVHSAFFYDEAVLLAVSIMHGSALIFFALHFFWVRFLPHS